MQPDDRADSGRESCDRWDVLNPWRRLIDNV
jgi:hypothetical protein